MFCFRESQQVSSLLNLRSVLYECGNASSRFFFSSERERKGGERETDSMMTVCLLLQYHAITNGMKFSCVKRNVTWPCTRGWYWGWGPAGLGLGAAAFVGRNLKPKSSPHCLREGRGKKSVNRASGVRRFLFPRLFLNSLQL